MAAKMLIRAGANLEQKDDYCKATPLMWAAMEARDNDRGDVVEALIKAGADIDSTDSENNTALIHACNNRNSSICKALIDGGASLKLHSYEEPLLVATRNRSADICKMLI